MSVWHEGYVVEENYTQGYYPTLSPTLQKFFTILSGYHPLQTEHETHMELGIGFGISINIHAATHEATFIGNDFNPSQIQSAQILADASKADLTLYEKSFEEMAKRDDLPQCNSISLHGIWSWISDENRDHIMTIIKKCLKPGGIVYNSYNVISGHNAFLPWRVLLYENYQKQNGTPSQRAKLSIEFIESIFQKDENILKNNPRLQAEWLSIEKHHKTGNYSYLLHEYFNSDWHNFTLIDVAKELSQAKLNFIGSASQNHLLNPIVASKTLQDLLQQESTLVGKEQLQDNLTYNAFRQDFFIKGGLKLSTHEQQEYLDSQKIIALKSLNDVKEVLGIKLNSDILEPLVNHFKKDDYSAKSIAELFAVVDQKKYSYLNVLQTITLMVKAGLVSPSADKISQLSVERSKKLNLKILNNETIAINGCFIASPTTGLGVVTSGVSSIMLRILLSNNDISNDDLIDKVIEYLQENNLSLNDENKEKIKSKKAQKDFITKNSIPEISVWKALKII